MIPVKSSNIDAIGHDPATETLTVQFRNGTTYSYQNVPSHIFVKILEAPSVGAAFHTLVKSNPSAHPYTKVQ